MRDKHTNPKIQSRWEWRIFGADFAPQEARIRQYPCQRVRVSEELYLLSRLSPHNCKIRDGLMDIKNLVRRSDHQLELWRPVLKAGFPLEGELVKLLFKTLRIATTANYTNVTLEELRHNIAPQYPEMRLVEVAKERHGFTIEGVAVEIAALKVAEQTIVTIGAEHEEPERVLALVQDLGFLPSQNQNYIQALKQIVGWQ